MDLRTSGDLGVSLTPSPGVVTHLQVSAVPAYSDFDDEVLGGGGSNEKTRGYDDQEDGAADFDHLELGVAVVDAAPVTPETLGKFERCRLMRQLSKRCLETDPRRVVLGEEYPGLCDEVKDFYVGFKMGDCLAREVKSEEKESELLGRYVRENVAVMEFQIVNKPL